MDDDEDEPKKRSYKCGWIIAGIAVVALILLGVILFVLEEKNIKGGLNRYKLVDNEQTLYSYKAVLEVPDKAKSSKLPYSEEDNNQEMKNLMFEMDMPMRNTFHFQYYPVQNVQTGLGAITADPVPRFKVPNDMLNGYIPGDTGYRLKWGDASFSKDSGEFTLKDPNSGDDWITNKR